MKSKVVSLEKKYYKNSTSSIMHKQCEVSKASTEIMLNRVCNGNQKEFPFLN